MRFLPQSVGSGFHFFFPSIFLFSFFGSTFIADMGGGCFSVCPFPNSFVSESKVMGGSWGF